MFIKQLLLSAVCATALAGSPLIAQTTTNQILARAERAISSIPSGEANFTSAYLDTRGKVQSKVSGVMYLEGEKFRLVYGDIVAVYSPKTLAYHDAGEETLTYSEPTSEELIQINPLHFLKSRAKGFSAKDFSTRSGSVCITFIPERKGSIRQIMVNFVEKTSLPNVISITGHDGSRVVVTVNAFRAVKAHPRDFFELNARQYPKSEVIDLR